MMLCLQLGTVWKWFYRTVSASFCRKCTLAPVVLDVINIRDSCPKSDQKIWPEPDFAGFAKKGRTCWSQIQYIPTFYWPCIYPVTQPTSPKLSHYSVHGVFFYFYLHCFAVIEVEVKSSKNTDKCRIRSTRGGQKVLSLTHLNER